jgi:hypothetical protein
VPLLALTYLPPTGGISAQPFSDLPPPNRACGFPRTRLSSTGLHPFKHRAGLTHDTTCSLSGEKTLTCSPSSYLKRYPEPSATMGTPSPSGSRLVGDPAFAHMRRKVRGGAPFASFPCSLPGTHRKEPSRAVVYCSLVRCRRFKDAATGAEFHRWKLGFNQCRLHPAYRTCGTDLPPSFRAFPLCRHALFPFRFPFQVGRLS